MTLPLDDTLVPARRNRLAIASAVVSCLSAPGVFVYGLGILTAIVGVVLGYVARRQIRRNDEPGAELATAGIAVGWSIIGLAAILGAVIAYLIWTVAGAGDD